MFDQRLTICVPSYNRPSQAIKLVKQLLPQAFERNVRIIVLDNASTENYATLFKKEPDLLSAMETGLVKIKRNSVNVGMSGNFLRAFEIVECDWLWLLSDDDDIFPNSVEIIVSTLVGAQGEYGFIKFSSPRNPQLQNESIENIEGFIDFNSKSTDNFNSFIFISNGVYRIDQFRKLVNIGYEHSNTFVPHFMMMATFISEGGRILVCQDEVASYVVPDVGYSYGLLAGLGVGAPKSILLNLSPKYAKHFYSLFFPHNDFKVIVDLFYHCRQSASKSVYRYLSKNYVFLASYARSWRVILILKSFVFISNIPVLFEALIYLLGSASPLLRRHIQEIKKRYS